MTNDEMRDLVKNLSDSDLSTLENFIMGEENERDAEKRRVRETAWNALTQEERDLITAEKAAAKKLKKEASQKRFVEVKKARKKADTIKLKNYFGEDYKSGMLKRFENLPDDNDKMSDAQDEFWRECSRALKA